MSLLAIIAASGKAPIAPLDPNSIAWSGYEADSFGGLSDNDNAPNWNDNTANNRDANVGATPKWRTNRINSLPALVFSGEDTYTVPDMTGLSAASIIEVCKVTNLVSTGGSRFGTSASASHYPYSNGLIYDDFCSTVRKDSITPVVTMSNWHTVYRWSASNSWGMKQNWISAHSTGTNTAGFLTNANIWSNGGNGVEGELAAVWIFPGVLTAPQEAGIGVWILNKYGV